MLGVIYNMRIYTTKITEQIDQNTLFHLLDYVKKESKEKILRFHNINDAIRTTVAELMIRWILTTESDTHNDNIDFYYNKYGKPFIRGMPGFNFNVSHSGNWIVCAIDDNELGIDIEKISPIEQDIARQFFSPKEVEDLLSLPECSRLEYFYDLWTLKESYIKAKGMGLSIPLDSFSIRRKSSSFYLAHSSDNIRYYFKQYNVDPEYKLSVCAKHNRFPLEAVRVEAEQVIETFLRR